MESDLVYDVLYGTRRRTYQPVRRQAPPRRTYVQQNPMDDMTRTVAGGVQVMVGVTAMSAMLGMIRGLQVK